MIELAMPAGVLENAIVAFNYGADAVYFGLKDFSARKGAGNFSIEDLSKIRQYALDRNKKIYITINTLIRDEDLERLYLTLCDVEKIGCDGIICQDLGVANIIRKDFPSLPLHASTQLAVHTVEGVKALQKLGFERIVLSRELNISEIEKIRKACPDIELKVFIHGALCYGFSGLCMASFLKTGRSANEGSCAQVCRTWFRDLDSGKKLYPFSLQDLDAGTLVKKLQDIGIDSLKVEGRLKGNEYVSAVTSYYRAIIDGEDQESLKPNVQSSFQRVSGLGYLEYSGPGHKRLTTGIYTGHIGESIGEVVATEWNSIKVKEYSPINPYDGLMILAYKKDGMPEPIKFSAHILKREKDIATLSLDGEKKFAIGTEVRRISNSALKTKAPNTDIPLYKGKVDITVAITDKALIVNKEEFPITVEKGMKDGWRDSVEKIFRQTGDAQFSIGSLKINNISSFDTPFIRASEVKAIRREAYSRIKIEDRKEKHYQIQTTTKVPTIEILPNRKLLSSANLPWNTKGIDINGIWYITMPAVTYSEERLFVDVEKEAAAHEKVRIGLNNIGQISFAKAHPEYEYFADIYLYMANREAAVLLYKEIPNLIGGYLWLETESYLKPWPFTPTIVSDFKPPLFISRSCYRHDSLGLPCNGCKRHHLFTIEQNKTDYNVVVEDCSTYVYEKN